MIEINLLEKKKQFRLPVVLGIDLNEVNWKPLVFAYVVQFVVTSFILPEFDFGLKEMQDKVVPLKNELRKIQRDVRKNKGLTELLAAFEEQIARLKQREKEVEAVMQLKTNPKNVLSGITKIIPEDLWLDKLTIGSDKKIYMEGAAISYKSVGEFIIKSNELEFFNSTITIKDSTTEETKLYGTSYRLQKFKLEGAVSSFGVL